MSAKIASDRLRTRSINNLAQLSIRLICFWVALRVLKSDRTNMRFAIQICNNFFFVFLMQCSTNNGLLIEFLISLMCGVLIIIQHDEESMRRRKLKEKKSTQASLKIIYCCLLSVLLTYYILNSFLRNVRSLIAYITFVSCLMFHSFTNN